MAPTALYISSAIGLGHASKDLAIARELRALRPDLEIVWLAGDPASEVLKASGENVLAENEGWRGASAIAEQCTRNGQLNLVRYIYRSLPSWWANTRLIQAVLRSHHIDGIIGNEAWEVDVPLVAHLLRLPVPFVMITDFVGVDPMTSNPLEHVGAWLLNALWSLDGGVYDSSSRSMLFIGETDDVPSVPFGFALENRRKHARAHYEFVGHVILFDPSDFEDRAACRRRLGYGDETLIVCSVGGTAIGRDLMDLCGQAFAALRDHVPDAHMVLVCGPRLAAESFNVPEGAEVRGHVPRLYEHYAACDVAVVQCGASSTTELAALGRPFVYFPIAGHFEQELVAARLARYGAGRRMSLEDTTPDDLAQALAQECRNTATHASMPVDGARRAAQRALSVLALQP